MKIIKNSGKQQSAELVGGKAFNLFKLKSFGLNVPDWVVIDKTNLENIVADCGEDFAKAKAYIQDFKFDQTLLNEIKTSFNHAENILFSVRSSATQEDGMEHSFAGQFESHLYVTFHDIPKFVKHVWLSVYAERVQTYFKTKGLVFKPSMAVIVQAMVDPEISGVAFGINPSTGEKNSHIICSVYGVGEGIVSGELDADTYTFSQGKYEIQLAQKTKAGKKSSSGEIKYEDVAENLIRQSSLNDTQLKEIQSTLQLLENKLGIPQDIEFAYQNNQLFLLQTRPVTTVYTQNEVKQNNRIIWDNSNIIESYPGVTTPLTFSYISEAYKNVYEQLASIMGASQKQIQKNKAVFANMLGLINGRVYYNLLSWYKVLAIFPGFKLNARFMETMMGVKERFDLPQTNDNSKFKALFRTILMILKIIYHRFTIKKTTKNFLQDVNVEIDKIKKTNLDKLSAWELKELWINLDATLTPKWKAPLINDSFAMIYFGRLQKMTEKYIHSENKNIHNDLLCGSRDIISVEPIHRSIAIATKISQDEKLYGIFKNESAENVLKSLNEENYQLIKKEIEHYIEDFGDRCMGELKLETVSFKQDPTLFIKTLQALVSQGITNTSTNKRIDLDLRLNAENEVRKFLKNKPYTLYKYKSTLKKARYFVSNRENLRYERTRVFGITREIFTAIGRQFQTLNVLENYRDIFYLTKDEIFAFIDGTSVTKNLKNIVAIRKTEFEEFEKTEIPSERFTTFETVNVGNNFNQDVALSDHSNELKGQGCCPGIVKGRVRLVYNPNELNSLNGDILVTSSTDPGWVTLFPTTSAILVERGSLLSHSAIVSREMGIPCIVGVSGILKRLKTGDFIEMDGSTGIIKILNHEQ